MILHIFMDTVPVSTSLERSGLFIKQHEADDHVYDNYQIQYLSHVPFLLNIKALLFPTGGLLNLLLLNYITSG